jgi:hypothetical protein
VNNERIMATLPEGSTINRTAASSATSSPSGALRAGGKSLRERIAELIGVAHPDFRADLRRAAAKVCHVSM